METMKQLRHEALDCLTRQILPFWLQQMQDPEKGGWYGRMDGSGTLHKDAPRGAILYARLLWTFSSAYRVLSALPLGIDTGVLQQYHTVATQTARYIQDHFLDPEYGGTYWNIDAEGRPLDTKKQFYALGFMIYGFSEYARATGCTRARETAMQLFSLIETHAMDTEYGGYIEACTRNWQPISDMRLSEKDENFPKSQNTHLHILEPYTNLFRIAPVPEVEKALRNLLHLFMDRIINPSTYHLAQFFQMDWTRMGALESYGHDIECSWLLHEASLVLNDKELSDRVESIVREVAKASEKGLQPDGSMAYETGDADRHWWVQAETVVGFLNLYQHFGDKEALQKALRCWDYIRRHLIHPKYGEWYWSIRADGTPNQQDDLAGFWKCPYHNSRMCLEIIERSFAIS